MIFKKRTQNFLLDLEKRTQNVLGSILDKSTALAKIKLKKKKKERHKSPKPKVRIWVTVLDTNITYQNST